MATTDLLLGFGVLAFLKVKEIKAVCLSAWLPRGASVGRRLFPGQATSSRFA